MLTVSQAISNLNKDDKIISLNGYKIADIIDFRFHLEEENELSVIRHGQQRQIKATDDDLRNLSFIKDIPAVKKCVNKCKFCFIDQLPVGVRKSLYFKDDDWRLSFLTGNFITLTNLNKNQTQRIIIQRISPLYVSLHATGSVRDQLMGLRGPDNAFAILKDLDSEGIITHIQIVLCPDINDGLVLKETLHDSESLTNIKSVGLVPVGLTKYHRNGLRTFTPPESKNLIKEISELQTKYRTEKGLNWVYLADEFYLMAGLKVPETSYYDDFDQIENGIGLVRNWLDDFKKSLSLRSSELKGTPLALPRVSPIESYGNLKSKKFTALTGKLFGPMLQKALDSLNLGAKFKVQGVRNDFFGPKITVAGLLTGQDIINQVKMSSEPILIPDIMVNEDKLFLDDLSFADLKKGLPSAFLVPSSAKDFVDWLRKAIEQKLL